MSDKDDPENEPAQGTDKTGWEAHFDNRKAFTEAYRRWIGRVLDGKSFVEAVLEPRYCSTSPNRPRVVSAFLDDPDARNDLLAALWLAGDTERANQVLQRAALLAASRAISEGDIRAITTFVPKAQHLSKPRPPTPDEGARSAFDIQE